jgi:pilus assembly protein CpaB
VPAGTVVVPAGMQQVSLTLEPQRVVGGLLAPGDLVGVLVTDPTGEAKSASPYPTAQVLNGVLVTRVQGQAADAGTDSNGAIASAAGASSGSSAGSSTITVALTIEQAQLVVHAMEVQKVWLALQGTARSADSSTAGTTATTTAQGDDQ